MKTLFKFGAFHALILVTCLHAEMADGEIETTFLKKIPQGIQAVVEQGQYSPSAEQVQARNTDGNSKNSRGIVQIFTWTSEQPLVYLGVKTAGVQTRTTSGVPQQYALAIYPVEKDVDKAAFAAPIFSGTTRIDLGEAEKDDYLMFRFEKPLPLSKDAAYAVRLVPVEEVVDQSLLFYRTDSGKWGALDSGFGLQTNGDELVGTKSPQGGGYNFSFFVGYGNGYLEKSPAPGNFPRPFFKKIGNEKAEDIDPLTKRKRIVLTSGKYLDYLFYMHTGVWNTDRRFVLVESDRPRPDGKSEAGERQILSIDTQTGDIYWLATVPAPAVGKDVSKGIISSRHFHGSYSPTAGILVFMDMGCSTLYALRMSDGKLIELLNISDGDLIDSPEVSHDGKEILYMVSHPGPPTNDRFNGRFYTINALRFNPAQMKAIGEPRIITAMVGTKGRRPNGQEFTLIPCGHVLFRPGNMNDVFFVHQLLPFSTRRDGNPAYSHMWRTRLDRSILEPLMPQPRMDGYSHAVFSASGKYVYYVHEGQLERVDFDTKKVETITPGLKPWANHLSVDEKETLIAFDTYPPDGYSDKKLTDGTVGLCDMASGKTKVLASTRWAASHPRHPHPAIAPDASKVIWNDPLEDNKCRILAMPLDADVLNWK